MNRRWFLVVFFLVILNFWLLLAYQKKLLISHFPVLQKFNGFQGLITHNNEITLLLGGDVMLGRSVLSKSEKMKDYSYPFRQIADFSTKTDFFLVNLEAPFAQNCPLSDSGMVFCTREPMAAGLVLAGVDAVSLANNHIYNYGSEGLNYTKATLEKNGIAYFDSGLLLTKNIGRTKFGFIAFDFLTKIPQESDYRMVKNSQNEVDVLIISVHWGVEYQAKAGIRQKEIARRLIAEGADVIVGHHPHWVQEMQYINGKPVFFSLGNLVFDQMFSEETKKGLLVEIVYDNFQLKKVKTRNIYIENLGQPELTQ